MDWDLIVQALRNSMRPASLFVWAFIGVLLVYVFWPYTSVVLIIVPYALFRGWQNFRNQTEAGISKLPPLCREDWRVARSKLKRRSK
jgi:hypothetical protein